eukprot:733138-Rhodomonas_salina.3
MQCWNAFGCFVHQMLLYGVYRGSPRGRVKQGPNRTREGREQYKSCTRCSGSSTTTKDALLLLRTDVDRGPPPTAIAKTPFSFPSPRLVAAREQDPVRELVLSVDRQRPTKDRGPEPQRDREKNFSDLIPG